ncbi:uncharacterized protein UV8b_08132 [Ustilaginoidea virens]|uniref:Cytokinesis regulator n=2 Tax=Ustilaginoidea virens TaxID=1159556 RepID=A0A8E5HYJ7_USTVR|nr:uncharacterized protein UV8b_08132 [Ustilaginoidea virens]QUC23891.1 hypothetical protein UV8b_08132 [Ustilaginoidea virens]
MEPQPSKPQQLLENEIESWDNDEDFLVEGDELSFRSSFATAAGPASSLALSRPPSRRRDSASSHVSFRSEIESVAGEERQLYLPGDDETSTVDAIAVAEHAGIPLPKNVPPSALMGGTIKRLGGRKIKKIIQEDWENDLELPDASQGLNLKRKTYPEFPETLRQVSGGSIQSGPTKTVNSPTWAEPERRQSVQSNTSALSSAINLDRFKDTEEDGEFFNDGAATVKASRCGQPPQPVSFITPPTPQKSRKAKEPEDDFELDLELPSDGKLRLSTRKDIPKTPSSNFDDLDWGEGSLGTRYGGTRRDGRSNRSSSASALSPSISSSITAESEDETFDGLVLPSGPFNLKDRLQKRNKSFSPGRIPEESPAPAPTCSASKPAPAAADRDDFFDDLDIGDGNVFGPGKLTLHRNVKLKEVQTASPARPKTAVSLTFTNKPTSTTRLPRLNHERAHSTSLEPVYESSETATAWRNRRSHSRLGHSHQSSVSSLPTPTTTSPGRQFPLSAPAPRGSGREVGSRSSFSSLKSESSTTTSSQLLKQKRSLRGLSAQSSKPMPHRPCDRPPSRNETCRPQSGLRPKTPVERQRSGLTDSPGSLVRKPQPFLPAGASLGKSQHVASKTLRQFRRHDSDNCIDMRPMSRSFSRSAVRSPSPQRYRVAADTWERLSKPKNKRHFGDGHELDGFDDLPISRESETRFLKQPITSGSKATIRNRLYQNILPDRTATPAPLTPCLTAKTPTTTSTTTTTHTPRFARDTAASRIARETSLAQRAPSHGSLSSIAAQREAPLGPSPNMHHHHHHQQQQQQHSAHLPQASIRSKKKTKRPQQLKPHLISNLNSGKESKVVNGMYYNADTFRWEGNDNVLKAFDAAAATPSTATGSSQVAREKEVCTPRPALITNISATKGVQVVSGMVFDPQAMCWLKLGQESKARSDASDTMDGFDALNDEDEDVFKDIPDLEDKPAEEEGGEGGGRVSDVKDDWLVGEEFDVGPEFVRRQGEEEERWRKKCEKWVARGPRDRDMWRWTIRDLVSQFDELQM